MARGLCEYIRWDADPESTNPLTPIGLGAKGGSLSDAAEPEEEEYTGGQSSQFGGLNEFRVEVEFTARDLDFLALAKRASSGYPCSALTWFSIADAADGILKVYNYCRIATLRLSINNRGLLTGSASIQALHKFETTPGSPSPATGSPFTWYQASTLVCGLARKCQDLSFELDNQLDPETSLDGVNDAGQKRDPEDLGIGSEIVSAQATIWLPLADSVRGNRADDIGTSNSLQTAFERAGDTLTITAASMANAQYSQGVQVGRNRVSYDVAMRAKPNLGALTWTLV